VVYTNFYFSNEDHTFPIYYSAKSKFKREVLKYLTLSSKENKSMIKGLGYMGALII